MFFMVTAQIQNFLREETLNIVPKSTFKLQYWALIRMCLILTIYTDKF